MKDFTRIELLQITKTAFASGSYLVKWLFLCSYTNLKWFDFEGRSPWIVFQQFASSICKPKLHVLINRDYIVHLWWFSLSNTVLLYWHACRRQSCFSIYSRYPYTHACTCFTLVWLHTNNVDWVPSQREQEWVTNLLKCYFEFLRKMMVLRCTEEYWSKTVSIYSYWRNSVVWNILFLYEFVLFQYRYHC